MTADPKRSSQITTELDHRQDTNRRFGAVDFEDWLFQRLSLKPGQRVLDVGCGTGGHLLKLAGRAPQGHYHGVDISVSSIEKARRTAADQGLAATFSSGDAGDPDVLPGQQFDLILSVYALYYVQDHQAVLEACRRRLAEGGRLAVVAPYHGNNADWYGFLGAFMTMPEDVMWVADHFMKDVVLPFGHEHFPEVRSHLFQNRVEIPSREALQAYWESNIYHRPEWDEHFSRQAEEHFRTHSTFTITKRALLATMGPLS